MDDQPWDACAHVICPFLVGSQDSSSALLCLVSLHFGVKGEIPSLTPLWLSEL